MKIKFLATLFLTIILLGTFGVQKSWGAPSSTACCAGGTSYVPGHGECFDSATNIYIKTVCSIPPNNGTCVQKLFSSEWVCDFSISPTPTLTPAPLIKCCLNWLYDPDKKDCTNGINHKPTECNGFPCISTNGDYYCDFNPSAVSSSLPFDPCKNLADRAECEKCTGISSAGVFTACGTGSGASCGTWTSLGCIPNDPPNLVGYILRFGSGIAGGIAFLLILFGAAQIVMSGGVPEKIAAGKEVITSAMIGLVFIFISVLVLQIIGVKIIGIPGWT
jgi:hypothetical protein